MDHRVGPDPGHEFPDGRRLAQVPHDQPRPGIDRRPVAPFEIVEHRHFVAVVAQQFHGHAADVARAACHQYLHGFPF